jgi:1-aminocyclopropane-1-carboxylate deaminase
VILPSPIQAINDPIFEKKNITVLVKRDDLIHPVISGNKWRKLKFNVEKFKEGKYDKLLTFGGAYSNHIAATARAGKELGVETIGIIRGDELNADSNETLKQAHEDGMELFFTSRQEYALRDEKYYYEELRRRHGNIWIVPEGGANYYGVLGCQEIISEIHEDYDFIFTAAGTGTTAAGLLLTGANVVCISALKRGSFLKDNIAQHLMKFGLTIKDYETELDLQLDYHFGGYAKYDDRLINFMNDFEASQGISLDQVYTAKMMFALYKLVSDDYFPQGSTIVALHTGGLQGRRSVEHLLR